MGLVDYSPICLLFERRRYAVQLPIQWRNRLWWVVMDILTKMNIHDRLYLVILVVGEY